MLLYHFGSLLMPSRRLSSSFASRATLDPLSVPHARSPHPATRSHGSTFELSLVLRIEFQKRQRWQWPIAIPGTHPQKIHQHPSPEMRWWKAGNPGSTEYLLQERLESIWKYGVSTFQSSSQPATPSSSTYLTKLYSSRWDQTYFGKNAYHCLVTPIQPIRSEEWT